MIRCRENAKPDDFQFRLSSRERNALASLAANEFLSADESIGHLDSDADKVKRSRRSGTFDRKIIRRDIPEDARGREREREQRYLRRRAYARARLE